MTNIHFIFLNYFVHFLLNFFSPFFVIFFEINIIFFFALLDFFSFLGYILLNYFDFLFRLHRYYKENELFVAKAPFSSRVVQKTSSVDARDEKLHFRHASCKRRHQWTRVMKRRTSLTATTKFRFSSLDLATKTRCSQQRNLISSLSSATKIFS